MASRFEARARELMFNDPAAERRYVAIYEAGACPDCGERLADNYETTVVRHARLCKPATCKRCGGPKPTGQSCGCFDNGCQ